jgi:hypothetical protein
MFHIDGGFNFTYKAFMKTNRRINSLKTITVLAAIIFGLSPWLKADVVVLQSGAVITGNVLQQDANGVLLQTPYGTYRYPLTTVSDVKKEAATAPHVSNNGQIIPDWAQIVSLLATNGWAAGLKQVPATMIETGDFKSVPYVSFRSGDGGYEINIYGDLNHPAAIQIGAMNYQRQTALEKSNCVNFACSVLENHDVRQTIRTLNFDQQDTEQNGGLTIQTILPGAWGSYGGWWVSVRNDAALASAQASQAELSALTQPVVAATTNASMTTPTAVATAPQPTLPNTQPVTTTTTEPVTTYDATYGVAGWSQEEMASAHPATSSATTYPSATGPYKAAASSAALVYPRSYSRTDGTYDRADVRR